MYLPSKFHVPRSFVKRFELDVVEIQLVSQGLFFYMYTYVYTYLYVDYNTRLLIRYRIGFVVILTFKSHFYRT